MQNLFRNYIFQTQSFKLPIETFLALYAQQKSSSNLKTNNEPVKKVVNNDSFYNKKSLQHVHSRSEISPELRRKVRNLSAERKFIKYDEHLKRLVPTRERGISATPIKVKMGFKQESATNNEPLHIGNNRSYSVIHIERENIRRQLDMKEIQVAQMIENRKFITKSRSPVRESLSPDLSFRSNVTPKKTMADLVFEQEGFNSHSTTKESARLRYKNRDSIDFINE